MNLQNMPQGWAIASVDEVCELTAGGSAPQGDEFFSNGVFPFVRVQDMGRLGDEVYIRKTADLLNEKGTKKLRLFPQGSVLFTKSGASTLNNQRAILSCDSYIVSHIGVLIPYSGISNKWIYFWLKGIDFKKLAHSTVMPSLPLAKVSSLNLLIPPLNEQHRIAAKIEELFSELDNGIENLKAAQQQLKIYRQALLKHAFEGKLTAQWREQNQDKLETAEALIKRISQERAQRYQQQLADWEVAGKKGSKPKAPKPLPPLTAEELVALSDLPEGWHWCKLGDLIFSIDAGKSFKCDEREPHTNEIGVAKVSAVTWGEYDESESKTCTDASKENEAYFIKSSDFILSRANTIDLVGACVIARTVTKKIMLSDKTLRIIFSNDNQEYFLQYLRSRSGRKQIMLLSTGNQDSMRNIGQDRIRSIIIPVCSSVEMEVVTEIIASKLSEVDQIEQTITTSLQQAEALRQSILKKAFSGQLVAQDANDEPASVLLARIKAEKAVGCQHISEKAPVRRSSKVKSAEAS